MVETIICLKCKKLTPKKEIETFLTKSNLTLVKTKCSIFDVKKCKLVAKQPQAVRSTEFINAKKGEDLVDAIGKYVGEFLFSGSNYRSPGTKFQEKIAREDKPVYRVDEAAMRYDLSYNIY